VERIGRGVFAHVRREETTVRLYLIGEIEGLPLHVAVETTAELADAFGRVLGYRFVTRPELEHLPGGLDALQAWDGKDDQTFRRHTRWLQETLDAEERSFDVMTPAEREEWLRPRLLDAGRLPAEIETLMRERRRKGFRVLSSEGTGGATGQPDSGGGDAGDSRQSK
jgi:hypothetical protein